MGDSLKHGVKRAVDPTWDQGKDDSKRRNWQDQEVMAMLNLVLKHNLVALSPTDAQIGETLVGPMLKLGYHRTAHQIKLKIKSMRKGYIRCKKGDRHPLRESPFYELIETLYRNVEHKNSESEDEDEECLNIWSEFEVYRMLAIIKQADLGQELAIGSFHMKPLRQIHKSLQKNRIIKSVEQIRTCLNSMRNSYIKHKQSLLCGKPGDCPYFEQLEGLWKREYANGHFHMMNEHEDFWSVEETIFLLESIKDSDIVGESLKCSQFAAKKIQEALKDSGYSRSRAEIVKKLQNLKQNFLSVNQYPQLDEAIAKFPFYHRYQKILGDSIETLNVAEENVEDPDETNEDFIVLERTKHSRGQQWNEEETSALLQLVEELHMEPVFTGRMTMDSVSKLAKPMEKLGYLRTVEQIKIKLRGLRQQYYRCIRSGSDSKTTLECLYFEQIHSFFSKEQPAKTTYIKQATKKRDVLIEIEVDVKDQERYSNGVKTDTSRTSRQSRRGRVTVQSNELWEPIETIRDEAEAKEDDCDRMSEASFEEVSSVDGEGTEQGVTEEEILPDVDCFGDSKYLDFKDETLPKKESFACQKSTNSQEFPLNEESLQGKSTSEMLWLVLQHEETMQMRHQAWLERQLELQREHDREQRTELLNELRELRKTIASTVFEAEVYEQN